MSRSSFTPSGPPASAASRPSSPRPSATQVCSFGDVKNSIIPDRALDGAIALAPTDGAPAGPVDGTAVVPISSQLEVPAVSAPQPSIKTITPFLVGNYHRDVATFPTSTLGHESSGSTSGGACPLVPHLGDYVSRRSFHKDAAALCATGPACPSKRSATSAVPFSATFSDEEGKAGEAAATLAPSTLQIAPRNDGWHAGPPWSALPDAASSAERTPREAPHVLPTARLDAVEATTSQGAPASAYHEPDSLYDLLDEDDALPTQREHGKRGGKKKTRCRRKAHRSGV